MTLQRYRREPSSLSQGVLLAAMLFVFMSSVNMMGSGFGLLGEGFARMLLTLTENPFTGILIGMVMTAVVQSSSMTTSMAVAMVSEGVIPIDNAVPVVMGANVGTTITCILVALGYVGRRGRFRRAFAAGTMHDFFNVLTVIILLPIEYYTRILRRSAVWMADHFAEFTHFSSARSPLRIVTGKPAEWLRYMLIDTVGLSARAAGIVMIVVALLLLFVSLYYMTRLLKGFMAARMSNILDKYLFRNAVTALLVGVVFTAAVQSSSVTTGLVVPLVTAGVLTHVQAFPYTMGANLGTTVTGILAALARGDTLGLSIAFVHMLFNMSGVAIFLPIKRIRHIPVSLALWLANLTLISRWYAVGFILIMFFVVPFIGIFGWRWFVGVFGTMWSGQGL